MDYYYMYGVVWVFAFELECSLVDDIAAIQRPAKVHVSFNAAKCPIMAPYHNPKLVSLPSPNDCPRLAPIHTAPFHCKYTWHEKIHFLYFNCLPFSARLQAAPNNKTLALVSIKIHLHTPHSTHNNPHTRILHHLD